MTELIARHVYRDIISHWFPTLPKFLFIILFYFYFLKVTLCIYSIRIRGFMRWWNQYFRSSIPELLVTDPRLKRIHSMLGEAYLKLYKGCCTIKTVVTQGKAWVLWLSCPYSTLYLLHHCHYQKSLSAPPLCFVVLSSNINVIEKLNLVLCMHNAVHFSDNQNVFV